MNTNAVRVYLAGPVTGCDRPQAIDWREWFTEKLRPHGIIGVSPLRCEPLIDGPRYGFTTPDPRFGSGRAIAAKNRLDAMSCDMTLAYVPTPAPGEPHTLGTIGEMFWANAVGKSTILVSQDPYILGHPVIDAAASWKLATLDQALEVILGVLVVYAAPPRQERRQEALLAA